MSDSGFDAGYVSENGGGGTGGPSATSAPAVGVYWGSNEKATVKTRGGPVPNSDYRPYISADEAALKLYEWRRSNPAKYQEIVDKLVKFGVIPVGASFDQVNAAWQNAIDASSIYTNQLHQDVSPTDAIELIGDPSKGTDALQPGESKVTQQTSSVNLFDPSTLRSTLNGAFHAALGRAPTKSEIAKFQAHVTSALKANPNTTTTTTGVDMANQGTQQSTSQGGVDVKQYAEDAAHQAPDFSGYRAAGLLDTFAGLMGPAVRL